MSGPLVTLAAVVGLGLAIWLDVSRPLFKLGYPASTIIAFAFSPGSTFWAFMCGFSVSLAIVEVAEWRRERRLAPIRALEREEAARRGTVVAQAVKAATVQAEVLASMEGAFRMGDYDAVMHRLFIWSQRQDHLLNGTETWKDNNP